MLVFFGIPVLEIAKCIFRIILKEAFITNVPETLHRYLILFTSYEIPNFSVGVLKSPLKLRNF